MSTTPSGTITASSVRTALNVAKDAIGTTNYPTNTISFNDSLVRLLSGKTTAGSAISMNDMRNKAGPSAYSTVISSSCSGSTENQLLSDGKYGSYSNIVYNSPNCRVGIITTWPTNLAGGSITTTYSGSWTDASSDYTHGTIFKNGTSVSFPINFTAGAQFSLPTNGAYLYIYLALSNISGYNSDGTPIIPWGITYPLWSSYPGYMGGWQGPNLNANSGQSYGLNFLLYGRATKNTAADYYSPGNITMSTNLPAGYTFNGTWPNYTSQTITFTNSSGTDYWIGSYLGANGHYTPIYLGQYDQQNAWHVYQNNIDVSGQSVYGLPLKSTLTINGTAVTYTAPNGATQAQVIAGFKSAINSAGISGVSAVDVTNGLGIINATSISFSASTTAGSSNYTPTIGSYGGF